MPRTMNDAPPTQNMGANEPGCCLLAIPLLILQEIANFLEQIFYPTGRE